MTVKLAMLHGSEELDIMARSILGMRFLRLLQNIWNGFFHKKSRLRSLDDPITRFLQHTNLFSRNKSRVKPGAFLPRPNSTVAGQLETSVFLISNLSEHKIWKIGERHVARKQKTIYGRADLPASAVLKAKLELEIDDIPLRHANIIGWPPDKASRKDLAVDLAQSSQLKLRL
ncbi:MAG: hypothetical protein ACE5HC_08655 [Candidatus Binatia bacterium]